MAPYRFQYEEPCAACGNPTNDACDGCSKPFDSGHLFLSGRTLTLDADPRNEDYAECPTWQRKEELCLSCFVQATGHAPRILWPDTSAETMLTLSGIEKGTIAPAGGDHVWYAPPRAGALLHLRWGGQTIDLDTFRTVQLLDWLKANEETIREQAKSASATLLPIARRDTERAIRADLGLYGGSSSEEE